MKINIKTTKAAILTRLRKPLIIDEINLPESLSENQVLVELIYSGVCGSQIGEIDGVKGPDKYLPHLLGHEGIGYVLSVGKNVNKVKKGDKVLLHWMVSKGKSSIPPIYKWKNKNLNAGLITTFNFHTVVSQTRITKINNSLNDLDALLLGCTASTALGSAIKLSNLQTKDIVAVSGCGPIGLYIIKILKFMNIKKIIAIDINDKKLNTAKSYGANFIFNSKQKNFNILKEKFLMGFDYFFECTGNSQVISQAFEVLNKAGSQILIGVPKYKSKSYFNTLEINLGKKIIGCKGGNFDPDNDFKKFFKIIQNKSLKRNNIIKNKIKLYEINDLINDTRKGKVVGKSIIVY